MFSLVTSALFHDRSYTVFLTVHTWQRIFAALQAQTGAKELITWDLNIDSTVCRAQQHAAGARKGEGGRPSRPVASPSSLDDHGR
ncbi:hypothetical protein SAMN05216532_8349 [Streptomyces sp. 2231.1]|nr:hypothetical protein SAMN05216532_8349 [Streptomyces sp. 2231.1]